MFRNTKATTGNITMSRSHGMFDCSAHCALLTSNPVRPHTTQRRPTLRDRVWRGGGRWVAGSAGTRPEPAYNLQLISQSTMSSWGATILCTSIFFDTRRHCCSSHCAASYCSGLHLVKTVLRMSYLTEIIINNDPQRFVFSAGSRL